MVLQCAHLCSPVSEQYSITWPLCTLQWDLQVISKASLTRSRARYRLHSEMDIHASLRHDSIVAYHGFLQDRTNVYLLLEPCSECRASVHTEAAQGTLWACLHAQHPTTPAVVANSCAVLLVHSFGL